MKREELIKLIMSHIYTRRIYAETLADDILQRFTDFLKVDKMERLPIKGYKVLNMYPVYVDDVYHGKEPFKIVGIRENQVELEGDFSGGTHNVTQKDWFDDDKVFIVKSI